LPSITETGKWCTGANPRIPLIAELRTLLLDSYYGRLILEPGGPDIDETVKTEVEAGVAPVFRA
jgi:hypothetical protein